MTVLDRFVEMFATVPKEDLFFIVFIAFGLAIMLIPPAIDEDP